MSIIQRIRARGAVMAIIIAIALLGFIAMDAFTGRSRLFDGGPSSTVGRVNGEKIDANAFRLAVAQMEENMSNQGYPSGESTRQQAIEETWNQEVNRIIQEQEVAKLGLTVTAKEMADLLYGPNPSPIAQQYLAPNGSYTAEGARQLIRNVERTGTKEQKFQLGQLLDYIKQSRLNEKFNALFATSVNVPKWKIEKQNADNSQMASVSFVRKAYAEIADSTVTVTDAEIKDYISKHKSDFKQEESRGINYVTFSAAPSAEDTAEVRDRVSSKVSEFSQTNDVKLFLAAEGSDFPYSGNYFKANDMQQAMKDTILKTPVGGTFGPYLDNTHFVVARMMSSLQVPDSVDVRHILIKTADFDPQNRRFVPVMDTSVARLRVDSVEKAIFAGANFDTLCARYSADGNKDSGGIYKNVTWGKMVPEFNDFIFTKGLGARGVVYTDYGFHYIEVLRHHGSGTRAVNVAYLAKPIVVSSKTENDARNLASQFAGNARDEKSFNEAFEKELRPKGYNKSIAYDIKPNGFNVMGLGVSRDFVRKVYEAKKGEALQPEKVGSNYVVAVVTEVNEEGTMSIARARADIEPLLRNKKKAEIIKKQIGNITTLEAAATALGKSIETADSIRITGGGSIGFEQRIVGAAFNADNRGKVVPEALEGRGGVYVVRVNNVSATPLADANVVEQRKAEIGRLKQQNMYFSPIATLKEAASITDNRAKHF